MPIFTCPHPCRCESMRAARNFCMKVQVIQFLTGLNENFSVVKTQVLLMDRLPSINKVYSMVVQEESNNTTPAPISVPIENSSILVNASDARKCYGRSILRTPQYIVPFSIGTITLWILLPEAWLPQCK